MARAYEDLRAFVLAQFPGVQDWLDWESCLEQSLVQALPHVNRDIPRVLVVQATGDGSTQEFTVTSYFDRELSSIKSVEYPTGENPRSYLKEGDDWFIYQDHTDAVKVVLVNDTPASTENLRFTITTNHTFDQQTSTMGTQSFGALCAKVCECMARIVEQRLIFTSAPHMDADTVQLGSNQVRGQKFIAQQWEEQYKKLAGLDMDVKAAQARADADIVMTTGREYIWHPNRSR